MPRTKHLDASDTRLTAADISVPSARSELLLTESLIDAASEIQKELLDESGKASPDAEVEADGNGNGRRSLKQRLGLERETKVIELKVPSQSQD